MPDDQPARGLLSGNNLPDAAAFSDMEAAVFLHRRMQMAVSEGRTGVVGMSELDMGSCLPVLRGCRERKAGRKRVCMGEKQIREREEGHRDARMEILSCSGRETASAGQGLSGKGLKKDGITESVPWTGMHACLAGSRNISSRSVREMRAQKKLSVRVGQTVLKRFCVLLSQDSWPAHPVSRQRQMPCRESPYSGRSQGMVNTQKGQKA